MAQRKIEVVAAAANHLSGMDFRTGPAVYRNKSPSVLATTMKMTMAPSLAASDYDAATRSYEVADVAPLAVEVDDAGAYDAVVAVAGVAALVAGVDANARADDEDVDVGGVDDDEEEAEVVLGVRVVADEVDAKVDAVVAAGAALCDET